MAAVALLVVLPAAVFAVPALFGHPVLPGDDLTQNFPLRVLVGRDIAAGRLPLLDPYIWSGSALLAGWNAGAAYPLTLLFAVLPGAAAWTFGLVVTFAVAGAGMFAFLRALRLGSLASFLGALSFALAGGMAAQVTHFGLVAGMSWVPVALLAVLRLTEPGERGLASRLRWTALLGLAAGLVILAGEPRAIVDAAAVAGLYTIWRLARLGRHAVRAVVPVAAGFVLGLGLGAVQWLPGLAAITTSQRGNGSLALFSSGSLPDRWLLLTLVPDVLGGSGSLSQPSFFGNYNMTEVTSYVGILPLVAAFALLARVRLRRRPPEWLVWHGCAVVGVLLALGGNTPLGGLLYRLPLYGGQRLQSRNILVLDLALAVLLAYWADRPFLARFPVTGRLVGGSVPVVGLGGLGGRDGLGGWDGLGGRPWLGRRGGGLRRGGPFRGGLHRGGLHRGAPLRGGRRVRVETVLSLVPPFGMLLVVVLGLTWGAGLLRWLGVGAPESVSVAGRLRPWLVPYAVIAVGAAALVIAGRRIRPRAWRRLCTGFVVADIVVFTVLSVVSVAPAGAGGAVASGAPAASAPSAASGAPTAVAGAGVRTVTHVTARVSGVTAGPAVAASPDPRPVSALGYTGRFAIYDPDLLDTAGLSVLGPPDLNDMSAGGMASIQGYTSLVDGPYAAATGSHDATGEGQNMLSPTAIGNSTLDQLDTSVLLTLPAYLTTTVGASGGGAGGAGGGAGGGAAAGPPGTGRRDVGASAETTWYLGQSIAVSRIEVPDADARADAAAGTEIGLTAEDGTTHWFRARAASPAALQVSLASPMAATTVLARAGGQPCPLGAPSVVESSGQVLVADGQLQNDLVPPHWDLVGFDGSFAVFADRFASGPLTIQALPVTRAADGPVRTTSAGSVQDGSVQDGSVQDSSALAGSSSVRVVSARGVSVRYVDAAGDEPVRATVSSLDGFQLVRSVAAIPGWTAVWRPRAGKATTLTVLTDGLVQAVVVPAGQGTLTWHYTAPRFTAGLTASLLSVLLIVLLSVAGALARRARALDRPRRPWRPSPSRRLPRRPLSHRGPDDGSDSGCSDRAWDDGLGEEQLSPSPFAAPDESVQV